jgi:hypothetical protein
VEYLSNPDSPGVESGFGFGLDLNERWIVIGAGVERTVAANGGAVYLYRRLPGGGVEFAQKLVAPDIRRAPRFGWSVSIDGETIAVGGENASRDFDRQGVVYIYEFLEGQWVFQQDVMHANPEPADRLGTSVDVRGDLLLAGAISDRTPTGIGAAYLIRRDLDGTWSQAAELVPDLFAVDVGVDVTLLADQAIVGSENSVHAFDLSCYLCPPDLDADGALTIFDFLLFFNLFDDGDPKADFDGDGELTIFDFLAFGTAFDAGC